MPSRSDPEVIDPKRIRQFAGFFKNYMGVSTFVVAALPIPVAQLNMIPMFEPDRNSTSVITSLTCFLLLAYIFYSRHRIARIIFFSPGLSEISDRNVSLRDEAAVRAGSRMFFSFLILFLIVVSLGCFFYYQNTWFDVTQAAAVTPTAPAAVAASSDDRIRLMAFYVGFFASAEAAFVLMATKEYLQELLGLSDNDLILEPPVPAAPEPPASS